MMIDETKIPMKDWFIGDVYHDNQVVGTFERVAGDGSKSYGTMVIGRCNQNFPQDARERINNLFAAAPDMLDALDNIRYMLEGPLTGEDAKEIRDYLSLEIHNWLGKLLRENNND